MIPHIERRPPQRGLSLVEVVVSTILVGVILVAAMNALGATIRGRTQTSDRARAEQYAQQLMTEILNAAYADSAFPVFGPESGESTANRSAFDDVDDFNGWNKSPLQDRSGVVLPNTTGWRRQVAVEFVNPLNPANTTGSDNGLKRITVTISRGGVLMTRLVSLRSDK